MLLRGQNKNFRLMEDVVKTLWIDIALVLTAVLGLSASGLAQSAQTQPIPGYEAAKDLPGAKELPDPSMTYKVVFDIVKAAPKADEVNPGLIGVVRYFNTLAKNSVSADHRTIAVVLHQDATEIVQNNETFKARNGGHDNPNIALIQSMKKAGVDFRVCGQAVLAKKIDPKTILPEIELDLWALTTLVNLQLRGYVHVGN
jgi:intracellular sulfur oxidation DsrE/DsrF family protein